MSAATPSVFAIVLNWNGCADTLECLASLRQSAYPRLTTLVVDNGSTDESASTIPEAYPECRFMPMGKNLGWAGGNNVGIETALHEGADLILLLNNDVVVYPETIATLVDTARRRDALVHPSIYYYDAPDVPQIDASTLAGENDGVFGTDPDGVIPMRHAYGACLLVPANLFRRIGGFDERFFLQMEETDFYYRARAVQVEACCNPRARVLHKESRSFGGVRTPTKAYYIARNYLLLLEKLRGTRLERSHSLKRYYWMLSEMAASDTSCDKTGASLASLTRWLTCSSSPKAHAVRRGILDYTMRRFGAMNNPTFARSNGIAPAP